MTSLTPTSTEEFPMRIRTLGITVLSATLVVLALVGVDGQVVDPPPIGNGKCSDPFDCTNIHDCAKAPGGQIHTCFDETTNEVATYTASETVRVTPVQRCLEELDGDNCKHKEAEEFDCARELYYTFKANEPNPDCGTLVCTKTIPYGTSCDPLD
jgi:hypothetical protein